MNKNIEIIDLLLKQEELNQEIRNIIHGSIEIRDKKYLYVHYRENGKTQSKYVGEYTKELHNLITDNNLKYRKIKRELKRINKRLIDLEYIKPDLKDIIKLNIDIAKTNLADNIYNQAILEGITTTLSDTEGIIENGIVNNMTMPDIMKIYNLKKSWDFILDENVITASSDYYLLSEINKLVINDFYYNAGCLRSTPVKISGTEYIPPFPIESKIKEDIDKILRKRLPKIDIAIELLLYVMKNQLFIDGNKRTAVIYANHYLISKGLGMISIPAELVNKYRDLLIDYYEDKNIKIKKFLKDFCYIKIK